MKKHEKGYQKVVATVNIKEFSRIVLCHQLWVKTEADEICKDKNYARLAKINKIYGLNNMNL